MDEQERSELESRVGWIVASVSSIWIPIAMVTPSSVPGAFATIGLVAVGLGSCWLFRRFVARY